MSFKPANIPFDLWIGNHKTLVRGFKVLVNEVETPVDVSTYTIYFTVYNGDTKLVEKSTVAGTVTVQGDDDEQVSVTLTPADTRTIAAAVYDDGVGPTHEFEFRQSGIQTTWVYGKIRLLGGDNIDT